MAVVLSMFLLLGYSMRDNRDPSSFRTPRPTPRVQPRFLLELEIADRRLKILTDGQVLGKRRLTESEWIDLRQHLSRLPRAGPGGQGRLRFYSGVGPEQLDFDPEKPPPEVARVVEQLQLLEVWP